MENTTKSSRVVVLVKALPQPSKTYGETVCCAGLTADGIWKRLFPVRFRHLAGESVFKRWDWVRFSYRRPTTDNRHESCHVFEDTIFVEGSLADAGRARFLERCIVKSPAHAMSLGQSLGLLRPAATRFYFRRKSSELQEASRDAFRRAARQTSMFDKELAEIEPSPFVFRFKFRDADGVEHDFENGDWESHAMFWRERSRTSEEAALRWMSETFNERYPAAGMAFAIGNQAKRPKTWQLLGVIRVDETNQLDMGL